MLLGLDAASFFSRGSLEERTDTALTDEDMSLPPMLRETPTLHGLLRPAVVRMGRLKGASKDDDVSSNGSAALSQEAT